MQLTQSAKLRIAQGCERTAFYLVLDLIALYANEKMGYSEASAILLSGLLGGAAYVGPIFGGVLADTVLTRARALAIGASVLSLSYLALAFQMPLLIVAIGIAIGNGLYKPSSTASCGQLAQKEDVRTAYYKFYMAINIGGLLAPIVGELSKHLFGWTITFLIAALFLQISKTIVTSPKMLEALDTQTTAINENVETQKYYTTEKTLYLLYFIATIFWCCFNQFAGSMTFWARDLTDRNIFGFVVAPALFAALNSLYVILLTDKPAKLCDKLNISFKSQLTIGMLFMSFAFFVMSMSALNTSQSNKASMLLLIFVYFVMTISELLISPAILTLISDSAPKNRTTLHMGFWFGSCAVGHFASGYLGSLKSSLGYDATFFMLTILAGIGALLMFVVNRNIKELNFNK